MEGLISTGTWNVERKLEKLESIRLTCPLDFRMPVELYIKARRHFFIFSVFIQLVAGVGYGQMFKQDNRRSSV